jgi:hypothetical protein
MLIYWRLSQPPMFSHNSSCRRAAAFEVASRVAAKQLDKTIQEMDVLSERVSVLVRPKKIYT